MSAHESIRNGYDTIRQHALEAIVIGAGLFAVGNAVQPSDAQAGKVIQGYAVAKGGEDLPGRAIPARLEEIMQQPEENWLTLPNGYRQKIDNWYTRNGDLESAQAEIDGFTEHCMEYSTNIAGKQFSVGRQSFSHRPGSKKINVTSSTYDNEIFVPLGPRSAEWLVDCDDFTTREIIIEPITKSGKRIKVAGKSVTFSNDDGNQFDGYVFEHKDKKVTLKVDEKYKNSKNLGFRTKVEVDVRQPYQGQIVLPSNDVQKKSRTWNTWLNKTKK